MEQEHNPNKNAELSMEQNYNQIDGIINNLPAPPPEDKPLDKVTRKPSTTYTTKEANSTIASTTSCCMPQERQPVQLPTC